MKKLLKLIVIAGFGIIPAMARAEERDSTGMPGDNFDLQGAMELFRTSKNLEAFEKALNTEKNAVNNLDLNGDKKVDYVSVFDKADGTNHAIIMRVAVNDKENQDIAVIAIQKQADKEAQLQIIGDKEIYGEETIMEPYDEATQKSTGPSAVLSSLQPVVVFVNVWSWPCVNYIYGPSYSYYNSPWYWGYYPNYWDPWAPYYYYDYYPRVHHYHYMYYHYAPACYVPHAQNVYYQHRSNSVTVNRRYADARQSYNASGGPRRSGVSQPAHNAGRNMGTQARPAVQPATPARNSGIERQPVSPEARPAPTRTAPSPVSPERTQPAAQPSRQQNNSPQPAARPAERPMRQSQPAANPAPQRQAPAARPMPSRQAPPMRSAPSAPARRGR